MKTIDVKLWDEAIKKTLARPLALAFGEDRFVASCWEEYYELLKKVKEDKKSFNGNKLMQIKGVTGFDYEEENNIVLIKTIKGIKYYKTGKISMDTLVKKVGQFLVE